MSWGGLMSKFLSLCVLCIFLVGCPGSVEYRNVPIPVYQVPMPPALERPVLPIHNLSTEDRNDSDKVIRAYLVSMRLLLNYAHAQTEILSTYKRMAERTESSFIEPVFTMSAAEDAEPLVMSDLEKRQLIAQGRQIQEDAASQFRNIQERYKQKERDIWGEYEAQDN